MQTTEDGECNDEATDLEELEEFARTFKQKRIKIGPLLYCQTVCFLNNNVCILIEIVVALKLIRAEMEIFVQFNGQFDATCFS